MNTLTRAIEDFQSNLMTTQNGCLWQSRGMGKSYGLAQRAFAQGPQTPIIIVAPSFRQSKIVLHCLRQICTEYMVDLDTVFNVRCIPVSQLEKTKQGIDNFLLLVDEFDFIPSEFQKHITTHDNWVGCASR